jgi:hypothetical protein
MFVIKERIYVHPVLHTQRETAVQIGVFLNGIYSLLITSRGRYKQLSRSTANSAVTMFIYHAVQTSVIYNVRGALVASHAVSTKGRVVYYSEIVTDEV